MVSNHNSKFSILISLLTILIHAFFSLAATPPPNGISNDVQECTQSLVGLATCLPYVGETARSPTPDCCSGLKQVLSTNKKCLCVIIKDRNDPNLGLNINVTLALGLPQVCHAPANISACPALLNLPPDSPDAKLFYPPQQHLNNNNATSPTVTAGGPTASVGPSSMGSSAQQQQSNSCRVGLDYLAAIALIWGALYYSNLA